VISLEAAIVIGAVCVLLEGFFSGAEIALISADRLKLRQRAAAPEAGAHKGQQLQARPHLQQANNRLGSNLAVVANSVVLTLALLQLDTANSELIAIAVISPVTLIVGEIVPKTVFQQRADLLATKVVYPLRMASIALRPGVLLMEGFASLMTRLAGVDRQRAFVTRDELLALIEAEAPATSEITAGEREMISNVFALSDSTVYDVMVPLSEVTALPEDTTVGEAALEVADKQHTRIPIYRSRVDDIVGVVHAFDLLKVGPGGKSQPVAEIARPAVFVPESKPTVDLLLELKSGRNQLAVVVDEYGGATGIATIEDILEEIVGEIEDEYDVGPSPIRREGVGTWRVEAKTPVARVNEELKLTLPEHEDYESLAGLLLEELKRIPRPGDTVGFDGVTITVLTASDRAVGDVRIQTSKRK
jgi:CBS domain containing-hemolysin-like protein